MIIHEQMMMFMKIWKTIIQQRKRVLIVFDEYGILKKISPIVTELLLRGRKRNISLVLISQSYFKVPKTRSNTLFYYANS